jgi:triosephosphate isomerase
MSRRTPFLGGNWKMNTDLASATALAEAVVDGTGPLAVGVDVAIMPPFPYLQACGGVLSSRSGGGRIMLGAQDLWHEPEGAFTGEVSAAMLVDLRVGCVIVGHSERRHVLHESDEVVALKLRAALDASLLAILCVGETQGERDADRTAEVVLGQLRSALEQVEPDDLGQLVVAYEPVWAIGTGKTASPADAQQVHALIRGSVKASYDDLLSQRLRIIYGGSVNGRNAAALFAEPDVDGGLVGGASLLAAEFATIAAAAAQRSARSA